MGAARAALLMLGAVLSIPTGSESVDTGEGRVVELPQQVTVEVQSRIEVPLGRTMVVASSTQDGRKTLLLLRSALRRHGR